MKSQLSLVGDNWAVTMGRDASGWRIEDATRIESNGHVETLALRRLGTRRFATRSRVIAASTGWLRKQGILQQRA